MINSEKISIVVSIYNEEEVLPAFLAETEQVIRRDALNAELIFVNDGSTDQSLNILCDWKKQTNIPIQIISFSRNFGHEAAMICGIDHATGDAIVCMDSDLQHPPQQLKPMLESFRQGNEIVTMVREKREDNSWMKNWLSRRFYGMINRLSEYQLDESASDFFLIARPVAEVLRNDFRERNRFLRGFIQIIGFTKCSLTYVAPKRPAGASKYSFFRLLKLSANAIVSFSKLPLYLGVYIGVLFAFFSLLLGGYTLWQYLFGNTPPSGYTTIVLFLSLSFSILFLLIGIIGMYVGYIFDENKRRPLYIVKNIH